MIKEIRERRSVRKFTNRKVAMRLIEEIVKDGTYAPSNCNQQLWKVIAITDNKIKDRLVKEACSSTIIQRVPVVLVLIHDGWNYKEAIQGCSFMAQNILLSATEKGLGSLPMNSYGNDNVIKNILNIPNNYLINCFVLIGYADNNYISMPKINRRPLSEVLYLNSCKLRHQIPYSYDPENWNKKDLINYQKYFCRKTTLGKEMDILDKKEKELILDVIDDEVKIIDFFSYDGSLLKYLPTKAISINLDEETGRYSQSANPKIIHWLFEDLNCTGKTSTLLFKIERLPYFLRQETYSKILGKLIIVSRLPSPLYMLFYNIMKWKFGDDIRKTGIYSFFGGYKPIGKKRLIKELKDNGFKTISTKRYYQIPPFFNQILQMFIQYKKSNGTSYLHRNKHVNIFTRALEWLINIQPKESIFGSILVLKVTK